MAAYSASWRNRRDEAGNSSSSLVRRSLGEGGLNPEQEIQKSGTLLIGGFFIDFLMQAEVGGHGYSPTLEFKGMLNVLSKTGDIKQASKSGASDWVTFQQEFASGLLADALIPYSYQVLNGRWTSEGRTIEELSDASEMGGDRIDRILKAEQLMIKDGSIKQVAVASENLGYGRNYLYIFSRDEQNPNKINALAVEHQGTAKEFGNFINLLSPESRFDKNVTFDAPLAFTNATQVNLNKISKAAEESFENDRRRREVKDYLFRIQRDTADFEGVVSRQDQRVRKLSIEIEKQIAKSDNLRAGLAQVAYGMNILAQHAYDGGYMNMKGASDRGFQKEHEFRVIRHPDAPPSANWRRRIARNDGRFVNKETVNEKDSQVNHRPPKNQSKPSFEVITVDGVLLDSYHPQVELSALTEEEQEEIIRVVVQEIIKPVIMPLVEVILQKLSQTGETDGQVFAVQTEGRRMTPPAGGSANQKDNSDDLVSRIISNMFKVPENTDLTKAPEYPESDITLSPMITEASDEIVSDGSVEDHEVNVTDVQKLLETFLSILTIGSDEEAEFGESDSAITVLNHEEMMATIDNLEMSDGESEKVYRDDETTDGVRELIILFIFHELVKICSSEELKMAYPDFEPLLVIIRLVVQDPILKKKYDLLFELIETMLKGELSFSESIDKLSLMELIEKLRSPSLLVARPRYVSKKKGKKRAVEFPQTGIIYSQLQLVSPLVMGGYSMTQ